MKLKVLTKLGDSAKNLLGPVGLKIKAASPEIFIGLGIAGVVGGTIYACVQTTKLKDIVEEGKSNRQNIKTSYDEISTSDVDPKEAEKAYRKDITNSYISTTGKVIKLYAGPVIVGTLSISCMLYSHKILRKRIVGLAAAYTTVSESYKKYRQNVIDRYGEDVDKELKYNMTKMKLKDVDPDSVNDDNKKSKVDVIDDTNPQDRTSDICGEYSDYARFFDSSSNRWEESPEYNLSFVKGAQSKFNDILVTRGYVFLNEIYEWFDIPMTEAGQVVGWIKNGDGDGYIDFFIHQPYRKTNADFVNGYENVILLDFNVDGYILDKVWRVDNKYPRLGND